MSDEIFVVLEWEGLFRYGDRVHEDWPRRLYLLPGRHGDRTSDRHPATR